MNHWDAIGYAAAGTVFVAFGMKEMVPLRLVAILSNVAFVAYGLGLHLPPVWLLHAVLLPLNAWRLAQALRWPGRRSEIDPAAGENGHPILLPIDRTRRDVLTPGFRAGSADRRARNIIRRR